MFGSSTNNGTIFKSQLTHLLCENEAVEVDAGYGGDPKMKNPNVGITRQMQKEKVLSGEDMKLWMPN